MLGQAVLVPVPGQRAGCKLFCDAEELKPLLWVGTVGLQGRQLVTAGCGLSELCQGSMGCVRQ